MAVPERGRCEWARCLGINSVAIGSFFGILFEDLRGRVLDKGGDIGLISILLERGLSTDVEAGRDTGVIGTEGILGVVENVDLN